MKIFRTVLKRTVLTSIEIFLFAVCIFMIIAYPNYKKVLSATSSFFTPLGGSIQDVEYCTCMASTLDYVQDITTNSQVEVMYMLGVTNLYEWYDPFISGPNVISNYMPISTECLVYEGEECEEEDEASGIWYQLGTSLY